MFRILVLGIILSAFLGGIIFLNPPPQAASAKPLSNQEVNREAILAATLQIIIETRLKTEAHPEGEQAIGIGLGTLVRSGGETLILTHNHWGEVLQSTSLVEFRDAGNNLLMRTLGAELLNLLRYEDEGTLILVAPSALLEVLLAAKAGSAGTVDQVPDGAVVQVAFRQPGNQEMVTIQEAVVERSCLCSRVRGFRLRSLSGQPLQKGDSGGGVWYEGKLVGNNWISVTADTPEEINAAGAVLQVGEITYTDISYTAGIPVGQP